MVDRRPPTWCQNTPGQVPQGVASRSGDRKAPVRRQGSHSGPDEVSGSGEGCDRSHSGDDAPRRIGSGQVTGTDAARQAAATATATQFN